MRLNKKIVSGIIIIITIGLFIYSYIVLPETLVVQIDFSGNPSNTEPKLFSLLIPMVLSFGGVINYYRYEETKSLTISIMEL